ncbi:MAG: sel1 repeat family protein [Candidatus Paracaedibacteraceae bacterium]|nr:sel1 repeat family protein [Candidatus Paracaedibacteraceae bacterium]
MRILLFWAVLTTLVSANSADHGVSLIYQGKNTEALGILEPLAKKSDPKAAFYASLILLFSDKPDLSKGLPLLEKAVQAGYGPALDTYAGLYLHGDILEKDLHKAKMYYEIASQRGYGPSQFNYGILCKNGEGLPLDLENAYVFLSLAADNYNDLGELTLDAAEFRDQVKANLPPDVLARAEQTAPRYKKEIARKCINND